MLGRLLCALGWPILVMASVAFLMNFHGWLVSGNRYNAIGAACSVVGIVGASVSIATRQDGHR